MPSSVCRESARLRRVAPCQMRLAADKAGFVRPTRGEREIRPGPQELEDQPLPLQAVEPRRLYRQIADQIAQLIASGEFPPGSRLPAERELAASLGRQPRVGARGDHLAGDGRPRRGARRHRHLRRGARPRRADRRARRRSRTVRAARRAQAGRRRDRRAGRGQQPAVGHRGAAAERARMEAHVDDFALREADDREFHLLLAKATGNGSLELVVEGLWNQRAELWGRMQQHFHTTDLAPQNDPRPRRDRRRDRRARRRRRARRDAPPPGARRARVPARRRRQQRASRCRASRARPRPRRSPGDARPRRMKLPQRRSRRIRQRSTCSPGSKSSSTTEESHEASVLPAPTGTSQRAAQPHSSALVRRRAASACRQARRCRRCPRARSRSTSSTSPAISR